MCGSIELFTLQYSALRQELVIVESVLLVPGECSCAYTCLCDTVCVHVCLNVCLCVCAYVCLCACGSVCI